MTTEARRLAAGRLRSLTDRTSHWYLFGLVWRNPLTRMGGLLLLAVVFAAWQAPLLASFDPLQVSPADRLLAPNWLHPFGTDEFGRDIYSRVVWGSRISLQVGVLAVVVCTAAGSLVGVVAGYYSRLDNVLMRIMDSMMAFPPVLLAIAIMASMGPRVENVVVALAVGYLPRMARIVRAQTLLVRELQYVEAAVAQGTPEWQILLRHILPNCLSPILVQASATFAYAVLTEAALSFLGVGVPAELASWGNILSDGRNFMIQAPWMTLFPGFAIVLTVLGLNLFGDGVRDIADPRSR